MSINMTDQGKNKKEITNIRNATQRLLENWRGANISQFILWCPVQPQYQNQTTHYKNTNHRTLSLINIYAKILKKFRKSNPTIYKKIIHNNKKIKWG